MGYVEGFVLAVPAANKQAYREHAAEAEPLFKEFGVTRMVEAWGDDVPDGKVNDFKTAVKAKADEVVVFGWFEYPSRQARDAANERMMTDPRMQTLGASMPFDGKRMIFGGFDVIVERGSAGAMGYTDGFVVPVPAGNQAAYRAMAEQAAEVFLEFGAMRVVEGWGDDIPDGALTDYNKAVQAIADEKVVCSWIEWPSKQARVDGWEKVMADPRMQPNPDTMPFDGKRMIYGGFAPLLDA